MLPDWNITFPKQASKRMGDGGPHVGAMIHELENCGYALINVNNTLTSWTDLSVCPPSHPFPSLFPSLSFICILIQVPPDLFCDFFNV